MQRKRGNVYENTVNKFMRERGVPREEAEVMMKEFMHENAMTQLALCHTKEAIERRKENNRRKRNLRERTKFLLEAALSENDDIKAQLIELGFEDDDMTQLDAVNLAILNNAKKGDVESARYLRDSSGQSPTANLAIGNMDGKPFSQIDFSKLSNEELAKMIEECS